MMDKNFKFTAHQRRVVFQQVGIPAGNMKHLYTSSLTMAFPEEIIINDDLYVFPLTLKNSDVMMNGIVVG